MRVNSHDESAQLGEESVGRYAVANCLVVKCPVSILSHLPPGLKYVFGKSGFTSTTFSAVFLPPVRGFENLAKAAIFR